MKTIMINDVLYKKLASLKGKRSFGRLIEELVVESSAKKKERLRKYFGVISDSEAAELRAGIADVRKNFKVRV